MISNVRDGGSAVHNGHDRSITKNSQVAQELWDAIKLEGITGRKTGQGLVR